MRTRIALLGWLAVLGASNVIASLIGLVRSMRKAPRHAVPSTPGGYYPSDAWFIRLVAPEQYPDDGNA